MLTTGCAVSGPEDEALDEAESGLFEAPQGFTYNTGSFDVAIINPIPTFGVAIVRGSFQVGRTNQYRTSYHAVPGGFCQRLWLTAPFDESPSKAGTNAGVGTLTVAAPAETIALDPVAATLYPPKIVNPAATRYGDAVTLTMPGTDQFAALSATLTVPFPGTQTAPLQGATAGPGALEITWSGDATAHDELVRYRIEQLPGDGTQPQNGTSAAPERMIDCYFASQLGAGTIPDSVLAFVRGHAVNTFFDTRTMSTSLRLRNGHYERTIASVGNSTTLRRLVVEK